MKRTQAEKNMILRALIRDIEKGLDKLKKMIKENKL